MPGYVVVTPARNEQATLRRTIESMVAQSVRPLEWVIVDDGSGDATGDLADAAAAEHPWIRAVHLPDRGARRMGYGSTFGAGVAAIDRDDWSYLGKIDADLAFGPDYFAEMLRRMDSDPELGIAGGGIHEPGPGGELRFVPHPLFHVRGAVKLYRRSCWERVADEAQGLAYDTLDEVRANQLGWSTRTFPDLVVHHLRPTGDSIGQWANAVKNGAIAWTVGYHPAFQIARSVSVLRTRRSFVPAAGLAWGYVDAALRRRPRADADLRRYVRRQQLRRLAGRPSIWR